MKNIKSLLAVSTLLFAVGFLQFAPVSAVCTPLPTIRGTATSTISVPATGTYRIWSRVKTADTTKNSYYLQIDDSSCNLSISATGITANTWTWVDYQGGTLTSKLDVSLTAGSHSLIMAGKDDNVQLDRLILLQDTTCIPTGAGDNCAFPPDSTPPTVGITAPASGATLTALTSVMANASDDTAVSKVEFFVDGVLKNTDSTSPYGFSLDPTILTSGSHTLTAKAYDNALNTTTSAVISFNTTTSAPSPSPTQTADTILPTVNITSPLQGTKLARKSTVSATAADNIGVSFLELKLDGAVYASGVTDKLSFTLNANTLSRGTHLIQATAKDAAGNVGTKTITVNK